MRRSPNRCGSIRSGSSTDRWKSMSADPFVIVGAGHAARRTAEALRERDAGVRIVMIGAERELPYDRPALSKDALLSDDGERRAFVRDAAWYDAQRIELRLGTRVDAIERDAHRVRLDDGTALPYRGSGYIPVRDYAPSAGRSVKALGRTIGHRYLGRMQPIEASVDFRVRLAHTALTPMSSLL
ncbi:hypothetical protein BDAG_04446 [Burkholderia dolosa AU0158]|nr:hypothetical protein BDAG_04446 [Burkholderia dolosa AU0158]